MVGYKVQHVYNKITTTMLETLRLLTGLHHSQSDVVVSWNINIQSIYVRSMFRDQITKSIHLYVYAQPRKKLNLSTAKFKQRVVKPKRHTNCQRAKSSYCRMEIVSITLHVNCLTKRVIKSQMEDVLYLISILQF